MSLSRDVAWFDRRGSLLDLPVLPTGGETLSCSTQHYEIAAPLGRVFATYVGTPPAAAWPAERITFRCAFAPGSSARIRPGDPWPGLSVGTRLFGDLAVVPLVFGRLLSIMVGVVVTRVEPLTEIRYDYLEGAVTRGWNSMLFSEPSPGRTRIDHVSWYRGTAALHRALMPLLQPVLHVGFVDALHARMKARIERGGAP